MIRHEDQSEKPGPVSPDEAYRKALLDLADVPMLSLTPSDMDSDVVEVVHMGATYRSLKADQQ